MQTVASRVVFEAAPAWWDHVTRTGDVVVGQKWMGDWRKAAEVAGIELHNTTSWVVRLEQVADRHTAIRAGDYACCEKDKKPVYIVRLAPADSTVSEQAESAG